MGSGRGHEQRCTLEKRSPIPVPNPIVKIGQGIQVKRSGKRSRQLTRGVDQKTFRAKEDASQSRERSGAPVYPEQRKAINAQCEKQNCHKLNRHVRHVEPN
jgi:hypothetical protein